MRLVRVYTVAIRGGEVDELKGCLGHELTGTIELRRTSAQEHSGSGQLYTCKHVCLCMCICVMSVYAHVCVCVCEMSVCVIVCNKHVCMCMSICVMSYV